MNLPDLIERLNDLVQEIEDNGRDPQDVEVLVGAQPSYPIAAAILGAVDAGELELQNPGALERNTVWLATDFVSGHGPRSPYAPRALWDRI